MNAWIGLGGNFNETATAVTAALSLLGNHPGITVLRTSRYTSPPWGDKDQADFINAVVELETRLGPADLMDFLLEVETRLGRVRGDRKWGPRCIDLDLLTYQDTKLKSNSLELPHPRMHLRAFVLVPLLELDPEFHIPGIGKARAALERLEKRELASVIPLTENEPEIRI